MEEAKIVGPFTHRVGSDDRVLKLVQGDRVLGEIHYYNSVPAVWDVIPREGPIHDLLAQEARNRGLLYGEDLPGDLLYDGEQPDES
jgi:hypothetical protein